MNIDPQVAGFKTEQLPALYQQLQDRLSQIPGVLNVGLSNYAPQDGCCANSGISFEDPAADAAKSKMTTWLRVSTHYFETLDIPLLRGRFIGDQDTASSRRVAIIDESFARKFFHGKDPIGQHFGMGGISGHSGDYEIVGVVQDTQYDAATVAQNPMFFLPLTQTVHYELASYNTTDKGSLYIGRIELQLPAHTRISSLPSAIPWQPSVPISPPGRWSV